jgi:hypothetical protein
MSIYELAMQDPVVQKKVLIEFGFGSVNPIKVERWLKKNHPYYYYELKRKAVSQKVVPLEVESMDKDRRNKILDAEATYSEFYRKSLT